MTMVFDITVYLVPALIILVIIADAQFSRGREKRHRTGYAKMEKLALFILVMIATVPLCVSLLAIIQPVSYFESVGTVGIGIISTVLLYLSFIAFGKRAETIG